MKLSKPRRRRSLPPALLVFLLLLLLSMLALLLALRQSTLTTLSTLSALSHRTSLHSLQATFLRHLLSAWRAAPLPVALLSSLSTSTLSDLTYALQSNPRPLLVIGAELTPHTHTLLTRASSTLAMQPDPRTHASLTRASNAPHIIAVRAAASAMTGTRTMAFHADGRACFDCLADDAEGVYFGEVDAIALDDLLFHGLLSRFSSMRPPQLERALLVIDVAGHEMEVVVGARRVVSAVADVVVAFSAALVAEETNALALLDELFKAGLECAAVGLGSVWDHAVTNGTKQEFYGRVRDAGADTHLFCSKRPSAAI